MQEPVYHIPALLNECLEGLNISPNGTYVDVTFGGGGHSREILSRLNERGRLFGFDQDLDAMQNIVDDFYRRDTEDFFIYKLVVESLDI